MPLSCVQVRGELEQSKTDEPEKVEKVKAPRREVWLLTTIFCWPLPTSFCSPSEQHTRSHCQFKLVIVVIWLNCAGHRVSHQHWQGRV